MGRIQQIAACLFVSVIAVTCACRPDSTSDSNDSKKSTSSTKPRQQSDAKQTDDKPKQKRAQTRTVNSVKLVYSPKYLVNLEGLEKLHSFDITKYQKIQQALIENGAARKKDFCEPEEVTREELLLIHTEKYLESLKSAKNLARYLEAPPLRWLGAKLLDERMLSCFRRATGGTILAGRLALKHGIAINIGGGFHHAKPDVGEGFCVYADVPIAIKKLQAEKLIKTALIIDVDVHQGNGTAVCLADDKTSFTFSIHQKDIYPIPKENSDLDVEITSGTDDQQYMKVLDQHLDKIITQSKPDICFIVGGCDTLDGDPLASVKMTEQGIIQRDFKIVQACVKAKVPVVFTLSGGYSKNAWRAQYLSIKNLVEKYPIAK